MGIRELLSRGKRPPELVGNWRMIRNDAQVAEGEGVAMTLYADGRLEYAIHDHDTAGVIRLVWHTEKDVIVTDQPSAPGRERTKYHFRSADVLVLESAEGTTVFQRI